MRWCCSLQPAQPPCFPAESTTSSGSRSARMPPLVDDRRSRAPPLRRVQRPRHARRRGPHGRVDGGHPRADVRAPLLRPALRRDDQPHALQRDRGGRPHVAAPHVELASRAPARPRRHPHRRHRTARAATRGSRSATPRNTPRRRLPALRRSSRRTIVSPRPSSTWQTRSTTCSSEHVVHEVYLAEQRRDRTGPSGPRVDPRAASASGSRSRSRRTDSASRAPSRASASAVVGRLRPLPLVSPQAGPARAQARVRHRRRRASRSWCSSPLMLACRSASS